MVIWIKGNIKTRLAKDCSNCKKYIPPKIPRGSVYYNERQDTKPKTIYMCLECLETWASQEPYDDRIIEALNKIKGAK